MTAATKERLKRLAPMVGYPIFYLFCVVVFFSWTFPYEKLKERIVTTFNAQQKTAASPQELQIDELDSSFFTGVKATGVKLVSPSSEPGKDPTTIKLDTARARISLLGLLVGNKDVSFSVEAFGGTIKGTFEDTGKQRDIHVDIDGVEIGKIDAIKAQTGFPLEGRLGGTVDLQLPEGKASKGNGSVRLEIRDMVAGTEKELTVKTPLGPFTLPRLRVGTFSINGDAKDGNLKLSKLGTSGGDVDATGDGRIQLREVVNDATLDVNLKVKVNDAYRNKNEKTKLLFGSPGSKEKPMLEMDPKLAKSKNAEGFYQLAMHGTLGKPDIGPTAATTGAVGGFNR